MKLLWKISNLVEKQHVANKSTKHKQAKKQAHKDRQIAGVLMISQL